MALPFDIYASNEIFDERIFFETNANIHLPGDQHAIRRFKVLEMVLQLERQGACFSVELCFSSELSDQHFSTDESNRI